MTVNAHVMRLHPFDDVVKAARKRMLEGWKIHLQFNCAHCGVKQTFAEKNYFSASGRCEACGKLTDLQKDGCNFMAIHALYVIIDNDEGTTFSRALLRLLRDTTIVSFKRKGKPTFVCPHELN